MNLEEEQREIWRIYKYALIHVGVDFTREDVQEALELCVEGLEDACRTTIRYWKENNKKIEQASAFFIKALYEQWQPYYWNAAWMEDPHFISPGQKWWQEAETGMGTDLRNSLVADVVDSESGADYIVFNNGRTLTLKLAQQLGWQKVIDYAQVPRGVAEDQRIAQS